MLQALPARVPADVAPGDAGQRDALRSDRRAAALVVVTGYLVVVSALVLVGLLLTQVLVPGTLGRWDLGWTRWLADHRGGALDDVTGLFSRSGDTAGVVVVALGAVVALWVRQRWDQMAVLVSALVLELSAFLAVNALVGRDRPPVSKLDSVPSTGSFPSGHAAATLVLYVALALLTNATTRSAVWRGLAWVAALVMPVAVGFSRVFRGMHHPTDVVFGYVLGGAVLLVAILAVRRWAPAPRRAS